ncbi:MAG: diguanylate cyclase [Clostridia bacterium]|nr:diguanylate cyclase [Clostridia bacterium]
MNILLILREELVCLIILLFLLRVSRAYRKGQDGRMFNRLLCLAIVHATLDAATVWTVNHTDTVSHAVNCAVHAVFYLSAILYAEQFLVYVIHLLAPEKERLWNRGLLILAGCYAAALPLMSIDFEPFRGTWSSAGSASAVGYGMGFVCLLLALFMILRNWGKISGHMKYALLSIVIILMAAEIAQVLVPEFLFTGGAATLATAGCFFTLENPAVNLERKAMVDAMTGVQNRNCYERDIQTYEASYLSNPAQRFIFLFADMNNLKSVNGLYGHDAGDEYITLIAMTLRSNLKNAEHIYRMGGDEFLAIYRDVDEDVVIREIEKIREACEEEAGRKQYRPLLAMGYAVSGPQYRSLHDVLRVADYMMYQNKANLKREIALETSQQGTKLNLTGLMDRVFEALSGSSERIYPFMQNMETQVTRVAPGLAERFGLGQEFFADFAGVWLERVHPEDRAAFRAEMTSAAQGKQPFREMTCRVMDRKGEYIPVSFHAGLYHGRDGEPDVFAGYVVPL